MRRWLRDFFHDLAGCPDMHSLGVFTPPVCDYCARRWERRRKEGK